MSTVILIVSLIADLVTVALVIAVYIRQEDKFSIFDTIVNSQNQIFRESLKDTFDMYKALSDQYHSMYDIYKTQLEVYEKMMDAYKTINESYTMTNKHYRELLDTWKEIDERYSVTCDQFEEIEKGLADIYSETTEHKCRCHIGPEVEDRE